VGIFSKIFNRNRERIQNKKIEVVGQTTMPNEESREKAQKILAFTQSPGWSPFLEVIEDELKKELLKSFELAQIGNKDAVMYTVGKLHGHWSILTIALKAEEIQKRLSIVKT
jgi:hypothetical protein